MTIKYLLRVMALIEGGTGLSLLFRPSVQARQIMGVTIGTPLEMFLGRSFGAALIAIAMVCWLAGNDARGKVAYGVVKAMLFYNIIAACCLFTLAWDWDCTDRFFGWASRFTWAWAPGAWLDYSASDVALPGRCPTRTSYGTGLYVGTCLLGVPIGPSGPGSEGEIFTLKWPDGAVCDHPGERATLNKAATRLIVDLDFKRILLEYSL